MTNAGRDTRRWGATLLWFLAVFSCAGSVRGTESTPTPAAPTPSLAHVTIQHVHDVLLLEPAPAPLEGELYTYYLLISERAATGEIPPWWAAYLYTSYFRDMLRDRPSGIPRRSREDLKSHLQAEIDYYYIRKRPGAQPAPFGAWIYEAIPAQ